MALTPEAVAGSPALAITLIHRVAAFPGGVNLKASRCGGRKWPSTLVGWLPHERKGLGRESYIPQPLPEKSCPGEVGASRKPGPSPLPAPASWKSQIRGKKGPCGPGAAARRGREEGCGRLGVCLTGCHQPQRKHKSHRLAHGSHAQVALYCEEAVGFPQ